MPSTRKPVRGAIRREADRRQPLGLQRVAHVQAHSPVNPPVTCDRLAWSTAVSAGRKCQTCGCWRHVKGGIRVHIYVIQPSGCARIDVALEGQGEFAPGPGDGTLSLGHRRFIDIVRAREAAMEPKRKLANGALGAAEFQRGAGNRGAADAARSEQGRALRIEGIQTQIYLTRQGVVKMLPKPLTAAAHQILEFLLMVGHMGEAECLGRRARQTGRRRNACATFQVVTK